MHALEILPQTGWAARRSNHFFKFLFHCNIKSCSTCSTLFDQSACILNIDRRAIPAVSVSTARKICSSFRFRLSNKSSWFYIKNSPITPVYKCDSKDSLGIVLFSKQFPVGKKNLRGYGTNGCTSLSRHLQNNIIYIVAQLLAQILSGPHTTLKLVHFYCSEIIIHLLKVESKIFISLLFFQ